MANQGPAQHVVVAGAAAAAVPGHRDAVPAVLNVARLFMLYGALTVVAATMGSPPAVVDDAGQAILGLGLWLLGVCLLAILIAGGRFPRLALVVAAVADAVLRGFNLQL